MTTTKPQLHQSDLGSLAMCAYRWQRERGKAFGIWPEYEKGLPSPAAAVGSAVHASIEANMLHKMSEKKLMSRAGVIEIAENDFEQRWGSEGVFIPPKDEANVHSIHENSVALAKLCAGVHYDVFAERVRPVAVEQRFVIEMPDHRFDLAGRIDLIEEGEVISDNKTVSPSRVAKSAETVQLAIYSLAAKVIGMFGGRYPRLVRLYQIKKLKMPVAVDPVEAVPDDRWISPALGRLQNLMDLVGAAQDKVLKELPPADPTSWICTRTWCHLADKCRYFSGRD